MKMKNFVILLGIFFSVVCITTSLQAQIQAGNAHFSKGDKFVNIGLGLGSSVGGGLKTVVPPFSVVYEQGISDRISVGGYFGYTSAHETYADIDINYNYSILGLRGSYHFSLTDKLDTYAGLMLGYIVASVDYDSDNPYLKDYNPSASGVGWSAHLGARYPVSKKLSAFAELGYGISVLNLGASIKL
jgi:hypothetical protein